jgi:hypothetical protein
MMETGRIAMKNRGARLAKLHAGPETVTGEIRLLDLGDWSKEVPLK